MKHLHVGSVIHRALVAAAGVVCLSGFLVVGSINVQADEYGCQNGSVCHVGSTEGHCNWDVDNHYCCCDTGTNCPEHQNCVQIIQQ